MTDTVCGLRMERRPRGEYYFFLTLETDNYGHLDEQIDEALEECHLLSFTAGGPYNLDEIRGMVSGELKIKALGQCLAYRQMRQEVSDDPFGQEDEHLSADQLTQQAETLLSYLSSLGSGRWSSFRTAAGALGVSEYARALARRLQLLGHLELSADGERWAVTPPQVVQAETRSGEPGSGTENPSGYVRRFRSCKQFNP
ncbi:hypothetical protein, partial [Deinococcus piscis]|uniref:hypothetical protein n=1 Tax=Deinococcus piscis TaxID=394230 RepID=UPI001E4C2441